MIMGVITVYSDSSSRKELVKMKAQVYGHTSIGVGGGKLRTGKKYCTNAEIYIPKSISSGAKNHINVNEKLHWK